MEGAINKLSDWFSDEQQVLDEMAHEVALAETVEEMVRAKNVYEVQDMKVKTILEALQLIGEQK